MIRACQMLGAQIEQLPDALHIHGVAGKPRTPADVIDAGNSGIVLRLVGAVAALSNGYAILTGDESIRTRRVIQPLLDGLTGLGAFAVSAPGEGRAPILVRGPLRPGVTHLVGHDSQPVTALLIAASLLPASSEIYVTDPGEKPWIEMTLSWLKRMGATYEHRDYVWYKLTGGTRFKAFDYSVPGDFSSAAFPLVAAALSDSEVTVEGLDMADVQGDKRIVTLLQEMGADVCVEGLRVTVRGGRRLRGMTIDVNDCIDALPILAVVGCVAEGETRLVNGSVARCKESDRITAVSTQLGAMGAYISELADGLVLRPTLLRGACVESYGDHRMAMSLAIAGLIASGETQINNVDCVRKSYPGFVDDLRCLGASL